MKQRLGLAAALLVPRRLVVLDEPTNGLDPAGTRDVRRVVAELRESGATVLLSSHLLAEVEAVCSHVAVLQTGTLLVAGELQTLLDADTGGLVVSTPDVDDAILALRAAGAPAYRAEGGVAVPPGPLEAPEIVAALVAAGRRGVGGPPAPGPPRGALRPPDRGGRVTTLETARPPPRSGGSRPPRSAGSCAARARSCCSGSWPSSPWRSASASP